MLRTLGFKRTAVHRTKKVSLFEQGEIRILVNVDQAGFANAAYAVHGTFAYAMALVVDDAVKAYERALALDAEPFTQPVAEGELELPAIRGVGGGIIYLIDDNSALGRFSEIDFQLGYGRQRSAVGRPFAH